MTQNEIIKLAKHYFGKDKQFIKKAVMSYEFNGKLEKQWNKEISNHIANPFAVNFNLHQEIVQSIKDNQVDQIDWDFVGDLSWTIDIVLNSKIDKVYDLDKKLAAKCKGTARILKVFISDLIPCYTFDLYYMTYNKPNNYFEFGPLTTLTKKENKILNVLQNYLESKNLFFVNQALASKKFKDLHSDTHSDGNASLFDVLFSDIHYYTNEIKRLSDKSIQEKSGTKFKWTETYDNKGKLKERIESRWTTAGDYFKIVLDNKGRVVEVGVTRKEIEKEKFISFKLDILENYKKQKKSLK
jgi:hypothetical protein